MRNTIPAADQRSGPGAARMRCMLCPPPRSPRYPRMSRSLLLLAGPGVAGGVDGGPAPRRQVVHQAMAGIGATDCPVRTSARRPSRGSTRRWCKAAWSMSAMTASTSWPACCSTPGARANLTEARMHAIRREALATIPASDRLIYAPPHPKYTMTVFTDIDCAYCRVFHQHIAQYNAEGIAVQYLFWPRNGIKAVPSGRDTPSYVKAVSVWCAKDRKKAFTDAKLGQRNARGDMPQPGGSRIPPGRAHRHRRHADHRCRGRHADQWLSAPGPAARGTAPEPGPRRRRACRQRRPEPGPGALAARGSSRGGVPGPWASDTMGVFLPQYAHDCS